MTKIEFTADAAGRLVRVDDVVGGTTSGRYQDTIIGTVLKIGKGKVQIEVTQGAGHSRPSPGDERWIATNRIFLVRSTNQPAPELLSAFRDDVDRTVTAVAAGRLTHEEALAQIVLCLGAVDDGGES
jgi:hypothetical protein